MRKPALTTLLAAGVIGATGSFAIAQMDSDTDTNAGMDMNRDAATQRQQMDNQSQRENQETVTGTIVSLQQYLKQGPDVAKNASSSWGDKGQTKALLSEDGELYIILGSQGHASQRLSATDSWRTQPDSTASTASAGSSTDAAATGRESEMGLIGVTEEADQAAATGQNGSAGQTARTGDRASMGSRDRADSTDRDRQNSTALNDILGDEDADRAADAGDDADVYGMADPQRRERGQHAGMLRIGQQMRVTGVVYERDGLRGIMVTTAQASPTGQLGQPQPTQP